jgi:hypothetical protein
MDTFYQKNGVSVDPSKVQEVMDWKTPTTVSEVRSFLGLAIYTRFLEDRQTNDKFATEGS